MHLTFHSIMIRPLSVPLFAWAIEFQKLIDCQYQLFRWNEDEKCSVFLPKLFDFAEKQAITCNVKFWLFDQTWHEPTYIDDWKRYGGASLSLVLKLKTPYFHRWIKTPQFYDIEHMIWKWWEWDYSPYLACHTNAAFQHFNKTLFAYSQ